VSDVREDILHLIHDLQTELRVLRGLGVRVVEHQAPKEPKPAEPSVKKPKYNAPKIGTAVALRMLLPGDLEFEADAIVNAANNQPCF